jgi:hypothetical protein
MEQWGQEQGWVNEGKTKGRQTRAEQGGRGSSKGGSRRAAAAAAVSSAMVATAVAATVAAAATTTAGMTAVYCGKKVLTSRISGPDKY